MSNDPPGDVRDVPRSPHRERPADDGQRMLSHYDESVVVDGEVEFAADADGSGDADEGQATLEALF